MPLGVLTFFCRIGPGRMPPGGSQVSESSRLSRKVWGNVFSTRENLTKEVGELVAKRAIEQGIKKVTFDRSGYKYHGRVKSLADGARSQGLEF